MVKFLVVMTLLALCMAISFTLGMVYNKRSNEEVKSELIGLDSELAYRVKHACGAGFEMYDWSVVQGDVLVDCTIKGKAVSAHYAIKTVVINR